MLKIARREVITCPTMSQCSKTSMTLIDARRGMGITGIRATLGVFRGSSN